MRQAVIYGPWLLYFVGVIAIAWLLPARLSAPGGAAGRAALRFLVGGLALALFSVAAAILPAQSMYFTGDALPESLPDVVLIGLLVAPKIWVPFLLFRVAVLWLRERRLAFGVAR